MSATKYIIEIEDEPLQRHSGAQAVWKAKGFNSLVFDGVGLKKLTPLDAELQDFLKEAKEKAYQEGMKAVWETVKKIMSNEEDGGLTYEETIKIFGTIEGSKICDMEPEEAVRRIKAYEEQKIEIGDEIAFRRSDAADTVIVVVHIHNDEYLEGVDKKGSVYVVRNARSWEKTGRSFPEMKDLMKKITEG